jgi:general secretion pathway protein L
MDYLFFQQGSYSLKYTVVRFERKKQLLLEAQFFHLRDLHQTRPHFAIEWWESIGQFFVPRESAAEVLESSLENNNPDDLWKNQQKKQWELLQAEHLDRWPKKWRDSFREFLSIKMLAEVKGHFPQARAIADVPPEYATGRLMDFPVTQKKKAEQMLMFQLDDQLPFPASQAHWAWEVYPDKKSIQAYVQVGQKVAWQQLVSLYGRYHALPHALTTEALVLAKAFSAETISSIDPAKETEGSFLIIDMGHERTQLFFFHRYRLVQTAILHIAGHTLTDVIANSYKITWDEAELYKHQHCFVSLNAESEDLDSNQQAFAVLMDKTLAPLLLEIKRWLIGHRVKFGQGIEKIFLAGGSSKIANMDFYLQHHLTLPCQVMTYHGHMGESLLSHLAHQNGEFAHCFNILFLWSQSARQKGGIAHFLTGMFAQKGSGGPDLFNIVFLQWRMSVLASIIGLGLMGRGLIVQQRTKNLEQELLGRLKSPLLNIPSKDHRLIKVDPSRLEMVIEKKTREKKQQGQSFQLGKKGKAPDVLLELAQLVANSEQVEMSSFTMDGDKVLGQFKSTSTSGLTQLEKALKELPYNDVVTNMESAKGELTVQLQL